MPTPQGSERSTTVRARREHAPDLSFRAAIAHPKAAPSPEDLELDSVWSAPWPGLDDECDPIDWPAWTDLFIVEAVLPAEGGGG